MEGITLSEKQLKEILDGVYSTGVSDGMCAVRHVPNIQGADKVIGNALEKALLIQSNNVNP